MATKKKKDEIIEQLKNPLTPEQYLDQQVTSNLNNPTKSAYSTPKPAKEAVSTPETPTIIRSGDTGAVTGITLPGGRQFGNLPPGHAQALLKAYNQQQQMYSGAVGMPEYLAQQDQLAARQQLAANVGNPGGLQLSDTTGQQLITQPTPLDWRQVLLNTLTDRSTYTTLASTTGVGAAGGSIIPGVGTTAGGVAGFTLGVYSVISSNIKSQKTDNVAAQKSVLTDGMMNLRQLAMLANIDPAHAGDYITSFNEQLDNINQAHQQLKIDTNTNLNLALGVDGTQQLQRYENFYGAGGGYEYYTAKMRLAIDRPDPNAAVQELIMTQNNENE